VVVQPLAMADASRRISLVFRHGFPRCVALEALANVILANLPDTVKRIASSKRTKKKICRKR